MQVRDVFGSCGLANAEAPNKSKYAVGQHSSDQVNYELVSTLNKAESLPGLTFTSTQMPDLSQLGQTGRSRVCPGNKDGAAMH
ncbi:MAG: hypothetical protein ACREDR_22720, partial [Blastocatellia bacterium]